MVTTSRDWIEARVTADMSTLSPAERIGILRTLRRYRELAKREIADWATKAK